MYKLKRTNAQDPEFIRLVGLLDAELEIRDGEDHSFYNQFNKLDFIKHVVLIYVNEMVVGCGAIKEFMPFTMEIKRMYVLNDKRGYGLASRILLELEIWAVELSCENIILETGMNQPEAISLYKKNSFEIIPNYGQYKGITSSICFKKHLL